MSSRVVIVGSGPAALMAADVISSNPTVAVTLIEKRKSPGRKILIAGSSGLNIGNHLPLIEFTKAYSGSLSPDFWSQLLKEFGTEQWIQFVEKELGRETFLGTSGRYFTREMKGSKLLRAWLDRLHSRGVQLLRGEECVDFSNDSVTLTSGQVLVADKIVFALGGASYEPFETPLRWTQMFTRKEIAFEPFSPSNTGYHVDPRVWTRALLQEAEGKPLKNILLTTKRGSKRGELVMTEYGIEGTPVYTYGCPGVARLDLKPTESFGELLKKCEEVKENLSPIRRIKKQLRLSEGSFALLFHLTSRETKRDLRALITALKSLPLPLTEARPLTESISSAGGISGKELHERSLNLTRFPNVYCAGEMLDWDAPTGGFLIQGCVSMGWRVGHRVLNEL